MKNQITISWDTNIGDSKISVSKAFKELWAIERADCLQDALGELTALYNDALMDIRNGK